MSEKLVLLWLIPALPLAASILVAFFGTWLLRGKSHWPVLIALGMAFMYSLVVLFEASAHGVLSYGYEWISIGGLDVTLVLRADALTALMLTTVTFVGLLVAFYSIGYMKGDPGYPRYFAEIALFVFAMTMLVLSSNFLMLYVFWEAVGLCSYLLIGFWFQRPSAAAAARKAFLVNRIGDFGFALGIFLIWVTFGTLDYDEVFNQIEPLRAEAATVQWFNGNVPPMQQEQLQQTAAWPLTAICLLLFMGAAGKSAQFPLHVWLPDAMEGPSPVSALIHAATMVTAGVYMVARCTPLFIHAPEAQLVVAGIGGFTALLAALMAITQNDLKRVLAYSTISQLGFMFLALGSAAGNRKLATFAAVAAIFHLFTHAFFKALLFLGAGSVMHAMGDVIDMRRLGGLRHVLKYTHWTFLIGSLALAGVIPLAGFWSKDEILAVVHEATHGPYGTYFTVLYIMALVTAFLTAFYTFRAYFMTFWGEERIPPEAGHHAHESPWVMLGPLFVLAACSLVVGVLVGPTQLLSHFLERTPGFPDAATHELNWGVLFGSLALALGGIGVAWLMYCRYRDLPMRGRVLFPRLYGLSVNKFYLDEIYHALIVRPVRIVAAVSRAFDQHIVDGLVDLVGWIPPLLSGQVFRPVQNGLVQFYALASFLGIAVFVVAWIWWCA